MDTNERERLMQIEINRLRIIVDEQCNTIQKYKEGIKALLNENSEQAE